MSTPRLGRLETVSLRTIWSNESENFTPWLAQEENLKLLGDTIGVELELEAQERFVGPFRADILCKNTLDDSWVLIENQLERTDHSHLGQLLTYAAGLEAVTIIWIAERFTEEHRAALDWLNQITDERFTFFGLEIELWRIGTSPVAPKFNIVSKPNDWSRTVQNSAKKVSEKSDLRQTQLQFWMAFKKYMEERSHLRPNKPNPSSAAIVSVGRSGMYLTAIISSWNSETNANEPEIRVELVVESKDSKQVYASLENQRQEIEREIGKSLIWHNPPDAKRCRIYLRHAADFLNSDSWPELHEWLRTNLEDFHRVFSPRVKKLTLRQAAAPEFETPGAVM